MGSSGACFDLLGPKLASKKPPQDAPRDPRNTPRALPVQTAHEASKTPQLMRDDFFPDGAKGAASQWRPWAHARLQGERWVPPPHPAPSAGSRGKQRPQRFHALLNVTLREAIL